MNRTDRIVFISLVLIAVCLLLVGIISQTLVRHLVQVTAPAVALLVHWKGATWRSYAALPIFGFWLLIMSLIWLYLAGISDFASGNYTLSEKILTAIIGLLCLCGLVTVVRHRPAVDASVAVGATVGFALLQLAAMWLSFTAIFANR